MMDIDQYILQKLMADPVDLLHKPFVIACDVHDTNYQ